MIITAFDIEYDFSIKKITSYGYWSSDGRHGNVGARRFCEILDQSDVLLGHNILNHDLPVLKKKLGFTPKCKEVLDTLYLSSLLFAEKPYHPLTKDYLTRFSISDRPNPSLDSKAVYGDLLNELIGKWEQLTEELQCLLYHLLSNQYGFSGFFKVIDFHPDLLFKKALELLTLDKVCATVDFKELTYKSPIAIAAAVTILQDIDNDSILPVWLSYQHPELKPIIEQLRSTDCGQPGCTYCRQYLSANAALKKFFGFKEFRKFSDAEDQPLQQQIVEAGIRAESFLAVLPTGGGKSLCYQIPALMAHKQRNALTVIISPLQSLMKDQVDNLRRRDITSAWTINGLVDSITRAKAFEATEDGSAAILYLSPESLRSRTIFRLLSKRDIARFVIDEAHCFSNWGHDFRTDYLYIARFIEKIEAYQPWNFGIPISCYTATAKPDVIRDISDYFNKRKQVILGLYTTNAERTNLSYSVTHADKEEKFERLGRILDQCKGPTIIYVSRTKQCEELAEKLNRQGRRALVYYGRLNSDIKEQNQDLFMEDNSGFDIMVATSAFGMGVDKDNITDVIHYEISGSLENYVQEAGRAGRDPSINANCHVLYNEEDLQKHFTLLNSTKLNKKDVDQIWRALKHFKRDRFSKSALEIAEQAGWNTEIRDLRTRVKTALSALEEEGFIKREENNTRVFAQSILVKNFEEARPIITKNIQNKVEQLEAIRIMQYLISREETQVDTISMHLDIDVIRVGFWINKFKDWKLIGDSLELSGKVNLSTGSKGSLKILQEAITIEQKLFDYFLKVGKDEIRIYKKQLHSDILDSEASARTFHFLEKILQAWQLIKSIKATVRYDNAHYLDIVFKPGLKESIQNSRNRQKLAIVLLQKLHDDFIEHVEEKDKIGDVRFVMSQLRQLITDEFNNQITTTELEEALFYLIRLGVIELDGSLLVFYQPMSITRLADRKQRYTRENHKTLEDFYTHKTEQIHIVGEYAQKMLRSHIEALQFVNDYFNKDYNQFLSKYFIRRKGVIRQPVTSKKFRELFASLSPDQLKIIKDGRSKYILVSAGPGSGKTRVLVHKVAAILLMEDVKPEQFLMLTFSRKAAEEMLERTRNIIGERAWGIDIKTFHSYAFQLVGVQGNLDQSKDAIARVAATLRADPGLFPSVAMKQVIVVDEYQDIDQQQFEFLRAIIQLSRDARVIVVGDDDQNIYGFRGSSTKYIRRFQSLDGCKTYFLQTNFRSKFNLVQFTNQLANHIPGDRLKQNKELIAHDQGKGVLIINEFPSDSKLIDTISRAIAQRPRTSSMAVLTKTNEEALELNYALNKLNISSNLILDQQEYRVCNILELRYFTFLLEKDTKLVTGFIGSENWFDCKLKLKRQFENSSILEEIITVIDRFEKNNDHLYLTDWKDYARALRQDDLIVDSLERVWISTMHKAKGKEFDAVYLLLEDFLSREAEEFRLLYVASTRARNELHIFVNNDFLKESIKNNGEWIRHEEIQSAISTIHLQFGLAHINLGTVKRHAAQVAIKQLTAGSPLSLSDDLVIIPGFSGFRLSKAAMRRLEKWNRKKYQLDEVVVDRIVVWKDGDSLEGKEYRVPVLRLRMRKGGMKL